ncbi:MAG: (Na+)-NQR maturation NqrM [Myxococcota bacterium]
MLATFLVTLLVFGTVILAMSLGVLVQGKRLKGSCGGTGKACSCSPLAARNCPVRRPEAAN